MQNFKLLQWGGTLALTLAVFSAAKADILYPYPFSKPAFEVGNAHDLSKAAQNKDLKQQGKAQSEGEEGSSSSLTLTSIKIIPSPKPAQNLPQNAEALSARVVPPVKSRTAQEKHAARQLSRSIENHIARGSPSYALKLLDTHSAGAYMTGKDVGILKSHIASKYFHMGKYDKALSTAKDSIATAENTVPLSHWIAGLLSWRAHHYSEASQYFERAADAKNASRWLKSAAAFWAARAYMKEGQLHRVSELLIKAQANPATFYGRLAGQILGGQDARILQAGDGQTSYSYGNGPLKNWTNQPSFPENWRVDPALIHAIVRQESKYDPKAVNTASGASGLMQLMPETARFIVSLRGQEDFNPDDLYDPVRNLEIGQDYILYLLDTNTVDGDLIKLVVAYNAGMGSLRRWAGQMGEEAASDPLLFIEMIPVAETRAYVERVLTNYWMYQDTHDGGNLTLLQLAQGQWPLYSYYKKSPGYRGSIASKSAQDAASGQLSLASNP